MTTDTVDKQYAVQVEIDGRLVTIGGMCYSGTDRAADGHYALWRGQPMLRLVLWHWMRRCGRLLSVSFNRAVVDGDASTNDTQLL